MSGVAPLRITAVFAVQSRYPLHAAQGYANGRNGEAAKIANNPADG